MKTAWICIVFAIMSMIGGCSGNYQSIYRHKPLTNGGSSITLVDAKQRAILASKKGTDEFKFCSEPSPDVFSIVAQSISAGGTFGQRADPKAIEAALNAAFSSSEQGSTIPRTQTINMLRELMFRTCERWLNSELGDAEMPIQAARDQRLMVSILAIEQLTGAVLPKPVVIGSSASASGGTSGADAAVRIDDAYKSLSAKTAAQQARQKDFDALNTGTDSCDALAKKVEAKETLDETQTKSNTSCDKARTALADAKLERASSAGHHQSLIDASRVGGIPVAAGASAASSMAGGGIDRAHTGNVNDVANIVKDIVQWNFDQDEFLLLCLRVVGGKALTNQTNSEAVQGNADIATACFDYIETTVQQKTMLADVSVAEIRASKARYDSEVTSSFEAFWADVVDEQGSINRTAVARAAKFARLNAGETACFDKAKTKQDFQVCFDKMAAPQRRDLVKRSS